MLGWWYLSGTYFTVVSLLSCSSPMLPHGATEMNLSLCIHVFGWVFASLLIYHLPLGSLTRRPQRFSDGICTIRCEDTWISTEFRLCWHLSFRLRWHKEWVLESMFVKTM